MFKVMKYLLLYILMYVSNVYASNDDDVTNNGSNHHNDYSINTTNNDTTVSGGSATISGIIGGSSSIGNVAGGSGGDVKNSGNSFNMHRVSQTANTTSTSGSSSVNNYNSLVSSPSVPSGSNSPGNIKLTTGATNFNTPRQTPMAYSPPTAVGYNPYKCTDSATLGVSSAFGAISGGMPVTDSVCEKLVMADYLARVAFEEEACEMLKSIPEMAEVFHKTNRVCKKPVVSARAPISLNTPTDNQWDKMISQRDLMLNAISNHRR